MTTGQLFVAGLRDALEFGMEYSLDWEAHPNGVSDSERWKAWCQFLEECTPEIKEAVNEALECDNE